MVTRLFALVSARSNDTKKNVLSRLMGPPSVAPHCALLERRLVESRRVAEDVDLLEVALRVQPICRGSSQNALPSKTLVPLLVTMFTTPPEALPNSAE